MPRIVQLAVLLIASLAWGPATVADERSDGCVTFHGEHELDRGASDVYIAGRDADGKGTCFLVPRAVTAVMTRKYYIDAGVIDTVGFEPADLLTYLRGKSEIAVGKSFRTVPKNLGDCLSSPLPLAVQVFSGKVYEPNRVEMFESKATELQSDMPGYRRFQEDGWRADYYVALDQDRGVKSFECGPYEDTEACALNGEYERTRILIGYRKSDMGQVEPERALQCASLIAGLFRIK